MRAAWFYLILFTLASSPALAQQQEIVNDIEAQTIEPNDQIRNGRIQGPRINSPGLGPTEQIRVQGIDKTPVQRNRGIRNQPIIAPGVNRQNVQVQRFANPGQKRTNKFAQRRKNQKSTAVLRSTKKHKHVPLPTRHERKMKVKGVRSFLDGYYVEDGVGYYPDMNENEWVWLPIQYR